MVKVTFNSALAQREPKKPEPVGAEESLLPDDTQDVKNGQHVCRRHPCLTSLGVLVIILSFAAIMAILVIFVFGSVGTMTPPVLTDQDYYYLEGGWCGTPDMPYYDDWENMMDFGYSDSEEATFYQPRLHFMEEKVWILEDDNVELIKVQGPEFPDLDSADIVHDFNKSLSVFVDFSVNKCYVTPLNTSAVLPPRELKELVANITAGTHMPQSYLVREQLVVTEQVDDVEVFGSFIFNKCQNYETYRLERRTTVTGIQKREALTCRKIHHFENTFVMETQICEL
ncbi:integral membrane protein 2B-like [Myripristis murdjan]|uniref:Integral membrane protein 2 n=1 Tax=Myripristis murdjan TaxID=586833 RepID=A0A667X4I9_9TELE|nr:integral membrane protein 2B-like [Myripristis murdjan]